jgi:hypothetical protein
MQKISAVINKELVEFSQPAHFRFETTTTGTDRLVAGVPHGNAGYLMALLDCVDGPFAILYILHTPRGEGAAGRYQSPELTKSQLGQFLINNRSYLESDARYDLWVHCFSSDSTIVWERHNLLYCYGPINCFESALVKLEFNKGEVSAAFPHAHHYRAEFDDAAKAILKGMVWSYSELRPEDEQ